MGLRPPPPSPPADAGRVGGRRRSPRTAGPASPRLRPRRLPPALPAVTQRPRRTRPAPRTLPPGGLPLLPSPPAARRTGAAAGPARRLSAAGARLGPPHPAAPPRPRAPRTHLNLLSMVTSRAPGSGPGAPRDKRPARQGRRGSAERGAAGAAQRRGGRRPMAAPLRSPGSGRDCGGAAAPPPPPSLSSCCSRSGTFWEPGSSAAAREPRGRCHLRAGGPCSPRQVRARPGSAGTGTGPLTGTFTRCQRGPEPGSGSCVRSHIAAALAPSVSTAAKRSFSY